MFQTYLLLFLSFSPFINSYSESGAGCFVEYADPKDTTFNGAAKILTETFAEGVKAVIGIDRIISDPIKALGYHPSHIEAYLSDPTCLSSIIIGKQQTWTGNYILDRNKLKFVVRTVLQPENAILFKSSVGMNYNIAKCFQLQFLSNRFLQTPYFDYYYCLSLPT
ncbi:hypothetical protein Aperf_G00000000272 [Anoplocephala perfoliata]